VDSHLLKLKSWRALTHALRGGPPGPEGAATKLQWSEAHQRLLDVAVDVLGERALAGPRPGDDSPAAAWVRDYLWSRAETILAGTSEVQRNVIAEQVLGMPKS
jgi:alkylation response protein AidB-like acyl-CoA dehydrogenase